MRKGSVREFYGWVMRHEQACNAYTIRTAKRRFRGRTNLKFSRVNISNPLLSSITRIAALPFHIISTVRPTPIPRNPNHDSIVSKMHYFEPLKVFVVLLSTIVNINVIISAASFVLSVITGISLVVVVVGSTPDTIPIFVLPIVALCRLYRPVWFRCAEMEIIGIG